MGSGARSVGGWRLEVGRSRRPPFQQARPRPGRPRPGRLRRPAASAGPVFLAVDGLQWDEMTYCWGEYSLLTSHSGMWTLEHLIRNPQSAMRNPLIASQEVDILLESSLQAGFLRENRLKPLLQSVKATPPAKMSRLCYATNPLADHYRQVNLRGVGLGQDEEFCALENVAADALAAGYQYPAIR